MDINDMDNKGDEIINIKMPRKDYIVLREMIERERTYSWIKSSVRSLWVWALAGGLLTVISLSDKIFGK